MINIIKSDFYRIFKSKAIWVALAIMIFNTVCSIYMVMPGSFGVSVRDESIIEETENNQFNELSYDELKNMSIADMRRLMLKVEGYQLDRDMLAHNINLYYIFIFVAVLAITVDFSCNSVKNTLSSAISYGKYFLAKFVFVMVFCLVLFFMNTYLIYFLNLLFNGRNVASGIVTVTKITLMQLPPILVFVSILCGLAFMFKKTSIFNTISIPFIMICQLLLNLAATIFKIKEKYTSYELQRMVIRLAGNPSAGYIVHSYIICAIIIILFSLVGWLSFRKAEIK